MDSLQESCHGPLQGEGTGQVFPGLALPQRNGTDSLPSPVPTVFLRIKTT